MKSWWTRLACRWCSKPVTQAAADGIWHHPDDGRPPFAEHYRCREKAAKR